MKPTVEDGLRILREAAEQAAQIRIELTDDYLALIARVEAMPENQPRALNDQHVRYVVIWWRPFVGTLVGVSQRSPLTLTASCG